MKRLSATAVVIAAVGVFAGYAADAQQQPPAPEVFLAQVDPSGRGLHSWVNISQSPGYDNQPSFLPDSSAVLFSSNRDGKQTDIYRYDIAKQSLTQLTKTAEPEYSPIVTPDGRTFSVIRVEPGDVQRLWRFNLDGSNPRLVLETIQPVGYHVWTDATHLALFILGAKGSPATLQFADTTTGTASVIASGIGRSILNRPKTGTVSFVTTGASRMIREFDPKSLSATGDIVAPLEGSQDAAWLPDGRLLMAAGTKISVWTPGSAGWAAWDDTGVARIA